MSNINGLSAYGAGSVRAKSNVENKPSSGRKSTDDVLNELREMMPGWTISTSTADWGEGFRNIQIDKDILRRMAEDPREMEKYKNLILKLEDTVPELEKWQQENPGVSLELGLSFDNHGNVTALATIKTLLGDEKSTTFQLPDNKSSWADFIRERLEALKQDFGDDINSTRTWIA
jgi:hypothetical protein